MTDFNPCQLDALDREVERFFLPMADEPKPKAPDAPCGRCHGTGWIKRYAHVLAGVCFRCWGAGVEMTEAERAQAAQDFKALRDFVAR